MNVGGHEHIGGRQPGRLLWYSQPIAFREAWRLQESVYAHRQRNACLDTLILLQHEPVYTMGRSTCSTHVPQGEAALRQSGAAVESVNRGGSITYHGPGQLVCYPILKLTRVASGPKAYVHMLEEVVIRTLAAWKIEGHRLQKKPGVFVQHGGMDHKIASIGIRVDRGITLHGFSLNIDLDLLPFHAIVPCGLEGAGITCMRNLCSSPVLLPEVAQALSTFFGERFRLSWFLETKIGLEPVLEGRLGSLAAEVS